tara:strand:- start:73 stop:939 length:867 start_codon:yes stop_codon:yes gene_type:complete
MSKYEDSIMIGGLGGSGTRVFAESLIHGGIRSSSDLNKAFDHLGSTLLFKRLDIFEDIRSGRFEMMWSLLEKAFHGGSRATPSEKSWLRSLTLEDRPNHDVRWLKRRRRSFLRDMKSKQNHSRWFVKEPNLHMITPNVLEIRDNIRMVMVVRHGVDMAFSTNHQQLNLWAPHVLNETDMCANPQSSLRYWCEIHRRFDELALKHPDRIRILSFDQLCQNPEPVLRSLFDFVGIDPTERLLETSFKGVKPPRSIGRRHNENLSMFSTSNLDFVDDFMDRIECRNESVTS